MTPVEIQKRKSVKRDPDPVPLKVVIAEVLEHLFKDRDKEPVKDE